jgi:hypothetical protein
VLDGKLAELRTEYLFGMAHVCHLGPAQVDGLSLGDFATLIRDIDSWAEAQKPKA